MSPDPSAPHLFSLDEANALIPKLELIMERMQRRVDETIAGALAFAQDSSFPEASEVLTDVYA